MSFCLILDQLSSKPLLQIHDLKYSKDGQQFLVISGTTQAKLYDRDGEEKYVHPKLVQVPVFIRFLGLRTSKETRTSGI